MSEPATETQAFLDDKTGREHLGAEEVHAEEDDPFKPVWATIGKMQEFAVPLVIGVIAALVMANAAPERYAKTFGEGYVATAHAGHNATAAAAGHRRLGGGGGELYTLPFCAILGHDFSLKFFANDIIMVFFFGIAAKEVTEALLPGGSLNPPSKAMNPLMATVGGVLGPVVTYLVLLEVFYGTGAFDSTCAQLLSEGFTGGCKAALAKGWGVVTATDIPLAWMVARLVFGNGHPAIDYLLLLAVADDALGLVIIAVFYPDPAHPAEPVYLLYVAFGMLMAYALRRWHYRIARVTHQSWVPYIVFGGLPAWIGLIKAHLHPALALVPIVPFMPGPKLEQLAHLTDDLEREVEQKVEARLRAETSGAGGGGQDSGMVLEASVKALKEQFDHARGRGVEIQAGLYSGIVGHHVDDKLKVIEYDEDGHAHAHASTIDNFEHAVKPYVDFGMCLFALCNAGVKVEGLGTMTWLIFLSLLVGKFIGIYGMAKLAKKMGYPAPLGVRSKHIRMVGLIGALGLTVALFVADAAFEPAKLKGDAKLGALFSGLAGFIAVAIGKFVDFTQEDIIEEAVAQIKEDIGIASEAGTQSLVSGAPSVAEDALATAGSQAAV